MDADEIGHHQKIANMAARHGQELTLASLLRIRPELATGADGTGATALHAAASKGQEKIVRMLLEAGASPDAQDKLGHTPLERAIDGGHLECAELMIPKAEALGMDHSPAMAAARKRAAGAIGWGDKERKAAAQAIAELLMAEPARRQAAALRESTPLARHAGGRKPSL